MSHHNLDELIHYALTHGIVYGVREPTLNAQKSNSMTMHAPFTLNPYRFSSSAFQKALVLAPIFNDLIDKISRDFDWLLNTLKNTALNDDFTGKLLQIFKIVQEEGIKQKIYLGIIRSDYMLHSVQSDPRLLLQVEINTIASSFGSLSTKISHMHRVFANSEANIPQNDALDEISAIIALAHQTFVKTLIPDSTTARPIMVVQPGEKNFSDQRLLQFNILEKHKINLMRLTLRDIFEKAKLSDSGFLEVEGTPVSVVYFRAGYDPKDYPSEDEWAARLLIERSTAIKCPNIGTHLAGCKKVQQALAVPGQLERFVESESDIALLREVFAGLYSLDLEEMCPTPGCVDFLQSIKARAIAAPDDFVMKPQREGGGNNLYGSEMVEALKTLDDQQLAAYILMERIRPPAQPAVLVREGSCIEGDCLCELGIFGVILSDGSPGEKSIKSATAAATAGAAAGAVAGTATEVDVAVPLPAPPPEHQTHVSAALAASAASASAPSASGPTGPDTATKAALPVNKLAGYLLRVKPEKALEGGVAAGFAVLSCPSLID